MGRQLPTSTGDALVNFIQTVYHYYHTHSRELPWRHNITLYRVLVSEFMLQQTQVSRAIVYYEPFLKQFPSLEAISHAPLAAVLRAWQGLGYNRRAKYLQQSAGVISTFIGQPTREQLCALPGIGEATAGAILTYTYNVPTVFIETNIRTAFLHHFFHGKENVNDRDVLPLITETLDQNNPREWYWALMDYGSSLKKQGRDNRRSAHHHIQKPFQGSNRQLRGKILAYVLNNPDYTLTQLNRDLPYSRIKIKNTLNQLASEELIPLPISR